MDYSWPCVVLSTVLLTASVVTSASVDLQPSPVATVTEGAVLWLTCTYHLAEGTLGQLQWISNDGGIVAIATPTAVPPCIVTVPGYNIDCNNLASNEVRLEILIPVHGDSYSFIFFPTDSTQTRIRPVSTQIAVEVPVTSVTFTSPVIDTVTVTPGGSHVYTCVTGSCRPSARINWYNDGVNVTTWAGSVRSNGDKFVTTSSLTLTGARGDSPVTIQCRASNVDRITPIQSGTNVFVVQWGPDGPPVISGYSQTTILYANDRLSLQCRQSGGNPLPALTWSGMCGGVTATNSNTATEAVSDITITVTKDYNQATCVCVSTHPVPQTPDRTQVTFTVYWGPDGPPVISGYSQTTILYANDRLSLHCRQSGGNPLPALTWSGMCGGVTATNSNTATEAVSDITITVTKDYNQATCVCVSTHPVPQTPDRTQVTFTVYFAAKFTINGQNHTFYSKLHAPVSIRIPFYSNPPVTSSADIEWTQLTNVTQVTASVRTTFYLHNEVIDLSVKGRTVTFLGQAAVMILSSFDQSLTGTYMVTVYNDGRRQQSTTTFSISLYGPPEKPTDVLVIDITSSSFTIEWTKGFNGGHVQTFVIMYGTTGGSSIQTVSVIEQQQSTYTKEITDLSPNTRYQLNMYAYNEEGNSSHSSAVITVETSQNLQETTSSPNVASIALFVIGSLMAAITTSVLIACLIYRRKRNRKSTTDGRNGIANSDRNGAQLPTRERGHSNDGSHYDDLNLAEREPQSIYHYIGGTKPGPSPRM